MIVLVTAHVEGAREDPETFLVDTSKVKDAIIRNLLENESEITIGDDIYEEYEDAYWNARASSVIRPVVKRSVNIYL